MSSYTEALKAGHPVDVSKKSPTLADGLAVPIVGPTSFKIAQRYTDAVAQVKEESLALAVLRYIEMEKIIVEGGGAASLAALMPGGPLHGRLNGKRVVACVCGGNVDSTVIGRAIERGLAADGRLLKLKCIISDRPGGIAKLTADIYAHGGSIKVSGSNQYCR